MLQTARCDQYKNPEKVTAYAIPVVSAMQCIMDISSESLLCNVKSDFLIRY
jgi:hypothetical protein